MFVAMVICLPLYYLKLCFLRRRLRAKQAAGETAELISNSENPQSSPFAVFAPAMADLLSTGLMFSGLVYCTASVYQMLRGAEVVFCALLSVVFLGHTLDKYMQIGIVLTVLGITCVGCAPMLAAQESEDDALLAGEQLFGIGLVIFSQLVQALQQILEEYLLQGSIQMDALMLAGYEGVWGGLLCLTVALPIFQWLPGSDGGHFEDSLDSLAMMRENHTIILFEGLYFTSVLGYNYFGLTMTQDYTAMHRVILEAARSMLVWAADLILFYVISDGEFGESWEWTSWVQLLGFAILLAGTMSYNYTTLFAPEEGEVMRKAGKSTGSVRSRASSGRARV